MTNEYKQLREKLILNQKEFALEMEVDVGTISRWERDKQRPKAKHLRKMERLRKKVGK